MPPTFDAIYGEDVVKKGAQNFFYFLPRKPTIPATAS